MSNEYYYLILVLAAFAAFALSVSVATIQYRSWVRRTQPVAERPAPQAAGRRVLVSAR